MIFSRLPAELVATIGMYADMRAFVSLRGASRSCCYILSAQRPVMVKIYLNVLDFEEDPMTTQFDFMQSHVELTVDVPMTIDSDLEHDAGPLGSFYVPTDILHQLDTRIRRYFAPRGNCLPPIKLDIQHAELSLSCPLPTDGVLMNVLPSVLWNTIRCPLDVAMTWPVPIQNMHIDVNMVSRLHV
jgi:hypothetical protein